MTRLTVRELVTEHRMDLFWEKVRITPTCWLWTGALDTKGYGHVVWSVGGAKFDLRAHRVAYEVEKGPVPKGLDLDHLCRVRACVRPAHLEAVTRSVNLRRGVGVGGARQRGVRRRPA